MFPNALNVPIINVNLNVPEIIEEVKCKFRLLLKNKMQKKKMILVKKCINPKYIQLARDL